MLLRSTLFVFISPVITLKFASWAIKKNLIAHSKKERTHIYLYYIKLILHGEYYKWGNTKSHIASNWTKCNKLRFKISPDVSPS